MPFVDVVKEAKFYEHRFVLWPRQWNAYGLSVSLEWRVLPFVKASERKIPTEPGVYVFLLQPGIASRLEASYPMYVGQTTRSLRERFREYLKEAQRDLGRPKILTLLKPYQGFVYFCCAAVTGRSSPMIIESKLIEALWPPVNEQYPASVRRIRAAF